MNNEKKSNNKKDDLIKSLNASENIQHISDITYKITGHPILLHDMEYKIISYTGNIVTDDPIWNEFITTGTVGPDRLKFYKDEGFLDTVANAEKITFLISDKLKYERIFGKLFNKDNIQVGCACIHACHKPFEEEDPEFFEIICDAISEKLGKNEFYQNYGQVYFETLVSKLIEGTLEDKKLYTAHVESIYAHLKTNLYLAVADIAECDSPHTRLAYFSDLLKRAHLDFKCSIYSNYIVIIVSTENTPLNAERDLKKLEKIFAKNNIHTGISSCFDNIFELRKYYTEAVNALNSNLKSTAAKI